MADFSSKAQASSSRGKAKATAVVLPATTTKAHTDKAKSALPLAYEAVSVNGFVTIDTRRVEKLIKELSNASAMHRIDVIRKGVSPAFVVEVADAMSMPRGRAFELVGVPRETLRRKSIQGVPLKPEASERAIGLARIIGEAERVVRESGAPKGFDAAAWAGRWLEQPNPALGGRAPAELLDTVEGQMLIIDLIGRAQSGAFA